MNSILETFNAKHLSTKELAANFVPTKAFGQASIKGHSLIVGPRGSGKTTLLRMLTSNSLNAWNHASAEKYRNLIDYEGIYVPGDVIWGQMLKSLKATWIDEGCAEQFAYTVFSTHVFIEMIESIENYLKIMRESMPEESYKHLLPKLGVAFSHIAKTLDLHINSYSMSNIKSELTLRLVKLGKYQRRAISEGTLKTAELSEDLPFSSIDLVQALEATLSFIDNVFEQPEHRWALLLDEFEIAPIELLERVISSMRSSSKKLFLKVALVPCGQQTSLQNEISNSNDFNIVELWHRSRREQKSFCEDLMASLFKVYDPEHLFENPSKIDNALSDPGETKQGQQYALNLHKRRRTACIKEFEELQNKDKSFADYLALRNIDYRNDLLEKELPSDLRKIIPIVYFRNVVEVFKKLCFP